MNKLIRNAIVFKSHLPSAKLLENHLMDNPFVELGPLDGCRAGFVRVPSGHEYVETFDGGLAFAVRYDEKILPASVVRAEVNKRCKAIKDEQDFNPGRKMRKEIEEKVIEEFLAIAFIRTKVITCLYDTTNNYLIIPVAAGTMADIINSKLIKAVGSIKTETIHVSVKNGVTSRLTEWAAGNKESFGETFSLGDVVKLERTVEKKEKISFDLESMDSATEGLLEALSAGFQVESVGMNHGSTAFRLTSDFKFKSVDFGYEAEEAEDPYSEWLQDAAIQVLEFSALVTSLCELLSYKEAAITESEGGEE